MQISLLSSQNIHDGIGIIFVLNPQKHEVKNSVPVSQKTYQISVMKTAVGAAQGSNCCLL
jgi:hypothetical protein